MAEMCNGVECQLVPHSLPLTVLKHAITSVPTSHDDTAAKFLLGPPLPPLTPATTHLGCSPVLPNPSAQPTHSLDRPPSSDPCDGVALYTCAARHCSCQPAVAYAKECHMGPRGVYL